MLLFQVKFISISSSSLSIAILENAGNDLNSVSNTDSSETESFLPPESERSEAKRDRCSDEQTGIKIFRIQEAAQYVDSNKRNLLPIIYFFEGTKCDTQLARILKIQYHLRKHAKGYFFYYYNPLVPGVH